MGSSSAAEIDRRYLAPALPPPVCWSTVTEPDLYKEYNALLNLYAKNYSDTESIKPVNNKLGKLVRRDCSIDWVYKDLFANKKLPVPFNPDLHESDATLWDDKHYKFVNPPNFADAEGTAEWLNDFGTQLGIFHGLVPRDEDSGAEQRRETQKCEDRVFHFERYNEECSEGHTPQKSTIFVIDSSLQQSYPAGASLRWPLVKALVAITPHNNQSQSKLIQTLIDDASNMFNSQLHCRYVVGLALWGPGDSMQFSVIVVDRAGAICTEPQPIGSYGAIHFSRVVYALTFGDSQLLGADPKVIINPLTGDPQVVMVDGQQFTIITKISASPHLFGRGTRVYIVKDQRGRFHILKDSWILASHDFPEIDYIKNISSKVQSEGLDDRSKYLSPRFVAGENHVNDTNEPKGLCRNGIARIRRRIVTGPIGDPITTYRSRVECLQALIDVVDRLEFFHDKCGIVHGDISIQNIVIVRFLPAIVSASQPDSDPLSVASTDSTANAQAPCQPDSHSSSLVDSLPTTTINPSTGMYQPSLPSANVGKVPLLFPKSGGSVIDFDCSCATNTLSAGPIGTVPYMAVELMVPKKPAVRELRHDLESVFFVLLHLARFTCGPPGASVGEVKVSHRIAQWHQEPNISIMQDMKQIDLTYIQRSAAEYLTDYWVPIAPYIQELVKVVYGNSLFADPKSQATCEAFKAVLARALKHCRSLSETPVRYPVVQRHPVARPNRKRARPESWTTDDDRISQSSCGWDSE